MLVHGGMDRASSFAKVSRRLESRGFTVVAFDRAGYAGASDEEPFTDVSRAAADLVARVGERRFVAVGHSFGGHLAMLAGIQRPDLVGAVGVFETPWSWRDFWPDDTSGAMATRAARAGTPADAAEAFFASLLGVDTWRRLPEPTRRRRRAEGPALLADLSSIESEPYDPTCLPVPLVVGRGSDAAPHQTAGTRWIVRQIPDAELFVIDGAGHGAHRSHPGAFASFVERVVARAGQART